MMNINLRVLLQCTVAVALAAGTTSSAWALDIKVKQEILLPFPSPHEPKAIDVAADGYVVAGIARGMKTSWVSKVDKQGKIAWTYSGAEDSARFLDPRSGYVGVIALATGDVLACGSISKPKAGRQVRQAVLTRLNSRGELQAEQVFGPAETDGVAFNDTSLIGCAKDSEGFVLVGRSERVRKGGGAERLTWISAYKSDSTPRWERVLTESYGPDSFELRADGRIATIEKFRDPSTSSIKTGLRMTDGANGQTHRVAVPADVVFVRSVPPDDQIRLISSNEGPGSEVLMFGEDLNSRGALMVTTKVIGAAAAYVLKTGALAQFGHASISANEYTAAASAISSDLKTSALQRFEAGGLSVDIAAVVPLLGGSEFAALRFSIGSNSGSGFIGPIISVIQVRN
ncbi:hypothetical protein [Roseateles sp. P5_E1]